MKKSEMKSFGFLLLIAVCIAPFAWIYSQVGFFGLLFLCAVLVACWIYFANRKRATKQKAFDDLAILVLHNRLSADDLSKIMSAVKNLGSHHLTLMGSLKQIRESIDLALGSKDREVAESRMQFAIERCADVVKNYSQLVSPHVISQVTDIISATQSKFNTQLYLNISSGCIAKAEGLKSDKGKLKYLELAKKIIEEGISLGKGDLEALSHALQAVDGMISELH